MFSCKLLFKIEELRNISKSIKTFVIGILKSKLYCGGRNQYVESVFFYSLGMTQLLI